MVGWAGVHCSFLQETSLRDLILLDSDSTETIFCNAKYVKHIQNSNETLELGTNGGPLGSTMKCDVPHLGTHWFNPKWITNIISLAHMANHFPVTYDSGKEKAFLVHMPNKIVKFKQMNNGLYAMNPHDKSRVNLTNMINTVDENKSPHVKHENYIMQWDRPVLMI